MPSKAIVGSAACGATALLMSACATHVTAPEPAEIPATLPEPDTTEPAEQDSEGAMPVEDGAEPEPQAVLFTPDESLKLCPTLGVSNRPATDADGYVTDFAPFARVTETVLLAIVPVNGACLSSGMGPRGEKLHKGIDLQTRPASMVHAAAAGTVREAGYRDDYGFQIVLDHGDDVFTRYAHLQGFEEGISVGATIDFGTPLGLMGNTASYYIPIHLHYEMLVGNYDTPADSFGLAPIDPFDYRLLDAFED